MNGPITWRSLFGTSPAEATRPMALAGATFDNAFNTWNKALEQQQAANQFAYNRQRDSNTQNFLDTLQQYHTPEELAAAQATLDQQRAGYGDMIDRAAVRGAQENRMGVLRDQLTKELAFTAQKQQYEDAQKVRDARPITDGLLTLGNSDNAAVRKSAREALQIYASQGMVPNSGEFTGKLVGSDRAAQEFGFKVNDESRRANEDVRAQTRLEDQLKTNAQQRAASQSNIEVNRLQADSLREQRQAAIAEKAIKTRLSALDSYVKTTAWDGGGLNTEEGMANFTKQLKGLGVSQAQQEDILYNLAKFYPNGLTQVMDTNGAPLKDANGLPVTMPIPVTTALSMVNKSTEGVHVPWLSSRRGDSFDDNLREALKDRGLYNSYQAISKARGGILDGSGVFKGMDTTPTEKDPSGKRLATTLSAEMEKKVQAAEADAQRLQAEADTQSQPSGKPIPVRPLGVGFNSLIPPRR